MAGPGGGGGGGVAAAVSARSVHPRDDAVGSALPLRSAVCAWGNRGPGGVDLARGSPSGEQQGWDLIPGGDEQARDRCGPSPPAPRGEGRLPRRPQETVHPRQQEQHGEGLECAGTGSGRPGELEGGAQRRLRCCGPRVGCMGAPHREDERCAWVTRPPRAQLPRRAAVSPWPSPQTIGSMLAARVAVVRPGAGWGQAGRDCAPWGPSGPYS